MILCVAVDEKNGMMFYGKRQSMDKKLREDLLSLSRASRLWMNGYSNRQFQEPDCGHVAVAEDFLEQAGEGEYCFVEDRGLSPYLEQAEQIIRYQWNRRYPADLYFDIDLSEGWKLEAVEEFVGTSHEKITKEVWKNEAYT